MSDFLALAFEHIRSKSRSADIEVKEELGQDGETVSEYGTLGYKERVPVVIGEGEFRRVTLGHSGEKCVIKASDMSDHAGQTPGVH